MLLKPAKIHKHIERNINYWEVIKRFKTFIKLHSITAFISFIIKMPTVKHASFGWVY